MNIIYLILTTLLDYKPENTSRLIAHSKKQPSIISLYTMDDTNIPAIHNLSREILYEGYMAIDSIIFLLETNIIAEKDLEMFIKRTVFVAKSYMLKWKDIRKYFLNFSTVVDINNEAIKHLLEVRNKIFEQDKSQIALALTRDRILNLNSRAKEDIVFLDENKDDSYIKMIKSLSKARNSEDGLRVNLDKEKFDFYKEDVDLTKKEILEAKIFLNLGGSFFSPGLLINLVKRRTIQKKHDILKKAITAFLEPVKLLHKNTVNRSFMAKKKEVIEFLINCLVIKNGPYRSLTDEGYLERTRLLDKVLADEIDQKEIRSKLDDLQEKDLKKMIYVFENITEKDLGHLVIHKLNIVDKYVKYIMDPQEHEKKELISLFNELVD